MWDQHGIERMVGLGWIRILMLVVMVVVVVV